MTNHPLRLFFNSTVASSVLTAVYGWPRISDGPENLSMLTRIQGDAAYLFDAIAPGAYLVDTFPFMKHLPTSLAKWKRLGKNWHDRETEMFEKLNEKVAEQKVSLRSKIRSWNFMFGIGVRRIATLHSGRPARRPSTFRTV